MSSDTGLNRSARTRMLSPPLRTDGGWVTRLAATSLWIKLIMYSLRFDYVTVTCVESWNWEEMMDDPSSVCWRMSAASQQPRIDTRVNFFWLSMTDERYRRLRTRLPAYGNILVLFSCEQTSITVLRPEIFRRRIFFFVLTHIHNQSTLQMLAVRKNHMYVKDSKTPAREFSCARVT